MNSLAKVLSKLFNQSESIQKRMKILRYIYEMTKTLEDLRNYSALFFVNMKFDTFIGRSENTLRIFNYQYPRYEQRLNQYKALAKRIKQTLQFGQAGKFGFYAMEKLLKKHPGPALPSMVITLDQLEILQRKNQLKSFRPEYPGVPFVNIGKIIEIQNIIGMVEEYQIRCEEYQIIKVKGISKMLCGLFNQCMEKE